MTSTLTASGRAAELFRGDEVRVEGRAKVSGKTAYTADVRLPGMLWAAFTTSPLAHASVVRIDTRAARAVPGVRAVLTSADLGPGKRSGRRLQDLPLLAYDRVRFIGDRVAAVAAETREAAEEAARLVDVEYAELPAVVDPFAALAPGAPVLHPEYATYNYLGQSYHVYNHGGTPPPQAHPNEQGSASVTFGEGDIEAIFARAAHVFEHRFETPRQHAGFIEPHATVVWIDGDGIVHVHTVNKQPFNVRNWMAGVTGIPRERIVVESATIGGDFGGKGHTIDEYICYYLAAATGRPVKHVYTYLDELQASSVRHKAYLTLKTALDERGRFLAHTSDVVYDGGAYAAGKPGPKMLPGAIGYATIPYRVPNVRIAVRSIYTNTIPGAHVRAPADPQVTFAWEAHVDAIAAALGFDPLELRLLNVARDGETALNGETVHRSQGVAVLARLQREIEARPAPPGRAWGVAMSCRHAGAGKTAVTATLHEDGTIDVVSGVPDVGCGAYTIAQRVFAATLGVELERVRVRGGSTGEAAPDPGSGGSRVTYLVGNAARVAAEALAAELARGAVAPIHVVGEWDGNRPENAHAMEYSFAGFGFDVEVDCATGTFTIHDAVLVADVGQIVNPLGHQGQLDGGFIAGLGLATMEEMPLDERGKLLALSLGEYKLPSIKDIPPLRTIHVTAEGGVGPYGAKMAGELGNCGVAPAIVNAIANACGARLCEYPATAERIFTALHGGG
jgi:putative selenate reductase molybdopterin-binding subunit